MPLKKTNHFEKIFNVTLKPAIGTKVGDGGPALDDDGPALDTKHFDWKSSFVKANRLQSKHTKGPDRDPALCMLDKHTRTTAPTCSDATAPALYTLSFLSRAPVKREHGG